MGIRCVIYLDDILLLASSPEAARKNTQLTLDLLRYLGLLVKPSKVEAVPAQQIEFLGLQVDSVKMMLTVPLDKIKKLQNKREGLEAETKQLQTALLKHFDQTLGGMKALPKTDKKSLSMSRLNDKTT